MAFQTAPTSITISPTGEYLATTHVGKLGVCLWSDRSFYQTTLVNSAPITEPAQMDDPIPIVESTEQSEESAMGLAPSIIIEDDPKKKCEDCKLPPEPKEQGLITMSGLPPAHWKNLFHLALIKERNKPKEAPKKPPSAPFFLQWRSGEDIGPPKEEEEPMEQDEWASAWADDEGGEALAVVDDDKKRAAASDEVAPKEELQRSKKRKITHHRSHLASLLDEGKKLGTYQAVTEHMATLGPSAIDVSLSTLCNGNHDLEDGLPLLHRAALWLVEACKSCERFEAINAYQHQFLHIHANVIAGIEEANLVDKSGDEEPVDFAEERKELLATIVELRQAQGSAGLKDKMQHSLCLLRHFLRMV